MPTVYDYLDAFDAAPTPTLRHAAAASLVHYLYFQGAVLRTRDPDAYSRAQSAMEWHVRTLMGLPTEEPPGVAPQEHPYMVITITHDEDRARAGYAWRVEFNNRTIPTLRGSAPTLAGLRRMLETLLAEKPKRRQRPRRGDAATP